MSVSEEKYKKLQDELKTLRAKVSMLNQGNLSFNLLVDFTDEFLWSLDKFLNLKYISPSVYKILGYTEQEFENFDPLRIGTKQYKEKIIERAKTDTKDPSISKKLSEIIHKNGNSVWIETSTTPILDELNQFNGLMGISRDITNHIELKRKIKENEVNLQAQIDNTSDSIWSIDVSYCIKTLNKPFQQNFKMAFGVDLKPGQSIISALPEPLKGVWKERYTKALNGKSFSITDSFEIENIPQYVENSFTPISFENRIIGVSVFSRNITEQKLFEKTLAENFANFESVIEHTEARIWSIDKNMNILTLNKNYKQDYKIAFELELQKGIFALENVPEPILSTWIDRYKRVLNGENFVIKDEYHIEGVAQFIEVSFNPILINNEVIGATCFSHDITQRRKSEIALEESEQKFKSLVSNIPSVSYRCITDKHSNMVFISDEIENLSGYPAYDFLHDNKQTYSSLIDPHDTEYVELLINEKLSLKQSFTVEYRIIHKNGETKWVNERGRGNFSETGELKSIDGVISDISLQKKSEQDLQNSELKFRILTDASIDMLSINSSTGLLQYITDALSKRLNHTIILASKINNNEDLLTFESFSGTSQDTLNEIFFELDHKPTKKAVKLTGKQVAEFKTGQILELNSDLSSIFNISYTKVQSNQVINKNRIKKIYAIGINRDNKLLAVLYFLSTSKFTNDDLSFVESFTNLSGIVLQRQQLLEEVRRSEDKFRSIFENTNSLISIEADNSFLLTNKAFEKVTGFSSEEIAHMNPMDLIHPEQKPFIKELHDIRQKGVEKSQNYVARIINKSFNEKWLDISASLIDYEEQTATLIIGSDITERKKADLELNKFSTGIMNSPSSIVITDIDGTIEYVNPYFTESTGYTFEEAVGQNPKILSSGNNSQELYNDMWSTILRGDVWNGEIQNKTKTGLKYWEAARIAPIFDQSGIITNFIAIKEDITERKRNLELIEQSEKDLREINAKKDKFFSIIAHDLRSPFSGLAGLTHLLKSTIKNLSSDEIDRYLDLINQSTQNIFKLLENLLSWAKSQTGKLEFKPELINLLDIAKEAILPIDITAKNKNIEISVNVDANLKIFADENMLNTIIRNIVSNAIKYTHKNGCIKISAYTKNINNNTYTEIAIEDNGVGIPDDKQNKLFKIEENYTTKGTEKESGTGLGLILCKEFVECHTGKIWCKSKEGVGTTFFVSLPNKKPRSNTKN